MALGEVGGTITVEVTYSVGAEIVVSVSVSAGVVTVSGGTVIVEVIYSVDAETVIVVRLSVGNELVWSLPGVLTDEAGTLHP